MVERLILVAALGLLVVAAVLLVRAWNERRVRSFQQTTPDWAALDAEPDGRRTLIAFSTPSCAACHQAQSPAIDLVRKQLGEEALRVIRVDAARQPRAARAFGILTVPSTVVVDAGGQRILAVNQGFAPSTRLVQQLQLA
jgi:thioredoxin-like negative regulator of GroEL